jgi:uncharacterized protein (DUF58 family)
MPDAKTQHKSAKASMAVRLEARTLAANYPALLAEALRVSAIMASGLHGRRKAGQGETFWQYRPYDSSDAARRIDWRRSARSDDLFVRDNEWEAANTIYLWQDRSAGMHWQSSKKLPLKSERSSVIILALAHLLMQGGERCAILGQDLRSRTGRKGLDRLFEDFMTSTGSKVDFKSEIKAHSKVIIASDFLGSLENWKIELAKLAARPSQGILLHIIDPAERSFPYKGRLKLKMPGFDTVKSLIVGRAETSRDDYQSRFEKHIADVDALAQSLGWQVVRHNTADTATLALNPLYGLLSGHAMQVL